MAGGPSTSNITNIFSRITLDEKEVDETKVYTYHFHHTTNPGDLKNFFSKFGKVQKACVHKCRKKVGSYTHYAFVIFENAEAAQKAVAANPSQLKMNDRVLKVRYPKPNPRKRIYTPIKGINKLEEKETKSREKVNAHISRGTELENYELEDNNISTGSRNYKINDLNDDCLHHIFSFFGIKEKIKMELVCKRWRSVLLDHWKTVTHLDFENKHRVVKLKENVLRGILQRCGMSLMKLDLPQFHKLRRNTVHMIAVLCKHLQHLSIQNLLLTAKDVQCLTANCKDLKSVVLKRPIYERYQIIQQILEKLPLKNFGFLHNHDKCRFLSVLPPTLKHLELHTCTEIEVHYLMTGLTRVTNLQSLRLRKCPLELLTNEKLYSEITNIEELSFTEYTKKNLAEQISFQVLPRLKNLTKLILRCSNVVNDERLALIASNCKKLNILDISVCRLHTGNSVSDIGIKALAKHSIITDLSFSFCHRLTDEGLFALANAGILKKLRCLHCPAVTDVGCTRLISLCMNLEVLDVSGCGKVTNVIIASAMSTINLRPENKILTLALEATSVKWDDVKETNGSVRLLKKNTFISCVKDPEPRIKKVRRIYRPYYRYRDYYDDDYERNRWS